MSSRVLMSRPGCIRSYRRGSGSPQVRLICFPHAGGAATFYRSWASHLPSEVDLLAVQYPGRQDRISEPCVEQMEPLVELVVSEIIGTLDRPTALFGHSMGAAVAYEVARRIEEIRDTPLRLLFVSGRTAPHRSRPGSIHRGTDAGLFGDIRRLGGTPDSVLDHPGLRDLLLPSLRGDYRLIETYQPQTIARLQTPIVAFVGDSDPDVSVVEAQAWSETTCAGFDLHLFRGEHFYLLENEAPLIERVLAHLRVSVAGPSSWPSTP
jgi:pyochelin biosynthetic protein PchC